MILADQDLKALLPKLNFETDEPTQAFDLAQIQPCSIDLRLDTCFWEPRKMRRGIAIDFRHSKYGELDVLRMFQRRWLRAGEGIVVKPGQMVLGRTFEKFTMPNGHAGKLEGRSTFARLGLAVHATGDFINPGWSGRMPLQLINHGAVPIMLTPYQPICQLLVSETSGNSAAPYGSSAAAAHKYTNDDGGPSRFWQDQNILKIQKARGETELSAQMKDDFIKIVGFKDTSVIDRFVDFLHALKAGQLSSSREVLARFADRETSRCKMIKARNTLLKWLPLLPAGTSLGCLFKTPYEAGHYVLWVFTVLSVPLGIWASGALEEPKPAITRADVDEEFGKS